jgi:hypothetical protein
VKIFKNRLKFVFWPIGVGMEVSNLKMFILDPLWGKMESNEDSDLL